MQSKDNLSAPIRPANEIERVAIVLPQDTTFYHEQRYLAVAWDKETAGATTGQIIGDHRQRLPFLAGYHLFSKLCGDRAMRTVDGSLRVNGQVITPERYLSLWRGTLAKPITAEQFTERHGQQVLLVLGAPLAPLRGQRSAWTSSPFVYFDDFEAAHRDRIEYRTDGGSEHFEIALDLREPNAARDAFYAASFIQETSLKDQGLVEVRLQPSRPAEPQFRAAITQPELFTAVA